jgi:hypothetical protein
MRWENQQNAPASLQDQTAENPTRQRFDYSPVRLASHQEDAAAESSTAVASGEFHGSLSVTAGNRQSQATATKTAATPSNANSRWQTASW